MESGPQHNKIHQGEWKTPQGFFEHQADAIAERALLFDSVKEGKNANRYQVAWTVPDGYFDQLAMNIANAVVARRVTPALRVSWQHVAVYLSVFALMLGAGFWQRINTPEYELQAAIQSLSQQQMLDIANSEVSLDETDLVLNGLLAEAHIEQVYQEAKESQEQFIFQTSDQQSTAIELYDPYSIQTP